MHGKSQRPYRLQFFDRFNISRDEYISADELAALRQRRAVKRNPFRMKQFHLIGVGCEFYRDQADVLMSQPFLYEPARLPRRERSALDSLREMGLHWEAMILACRLNCQAMLHRAPANSGNHVVSLAPVPVLFAPAY